MTERLSRRQALAGAAIAGVGVPMLAACGGSDTASDSNGGPSGDTSSSPGAALTSTADVAVGSGVILEAPAVVITQPTEGDFHAFSSICTHQGCPVTDFVDGDIHCSCHGSLFSATDGSVVKGPANKALAPFAIKVEGGDIVAG